MNGATGAMNRIMSREKKKVFVILGGNFVNVGAEAMTFVTVDALKRKYPDCIVVMISPLDAHKDNSAFSFEVVGFSESVIHHATTKGFDIRYYAAAFAKLLLRRGNSFKETADLTALLNECDAVFDISGYALSSQWSNEVNYAKLRYVNMFCDHGIPFYFMPQSFGPFDYKKDCEKVLAQLKEALVKSSMIFAREKEGYEHLSQLIGSKNVMSSCDMVLQSKGVNPENVYRIVPAMEPIKISTHKDNIAVIPNMRNFDHGNKDSIVNLYHSIIDRLIENGKNVYLISHSKEDMEACKLIKAQFSDEKKVSVLEERINSWNFEGLISQFDFAIASRFHSIVHSYKAGVPCIALGWATKYRELLESVGQKRFTFDVRHDIDGEEVLSAIDHMIASSSSEKQTIMKHVQNIQKLNCFDLIDF